MKKKLSKALVTTLGGLCQKDSLIGLMTRLYINVQSNIKSRLSCEEWDVHYEKFESESWVLVIICAKLLLLLSERFKYIPPSLGSYKMYP